MEVSATNSAPNFVVYDFYDTPQSYINYVLENYGRLRDYFDDGGSRKPFHVAMIMIVLSKLTAGAINATLIATDHKSYVEGAYPSILPALKMFDKNGRTVETFWKTYFQAERKILKNHVDLPIFTFNLYVSNAFAYCACVKSD